MRQFRVKFEMETPDNGENQSRYRTVKADKKKFRTLAAAEKRMLLYGPEPWLAFGKGPEDDWCHGKGRAEDCNSDGWDYGPLCKEKHTTAREFWEEKRSDMAIKIVRAWIEVRELTPWKTQP